MELRKDAKLGGEPTGSSPLHHIYGLVQNDYKLLSRSAYVHKDKKLRKNWSLSPLPPSNRCTFQPLHFLTSHYMTLYHFWSDDARVQTDMSLNYD